ncbi:MAG: glycosyltransferase family 4 protein [Kiritimatiellia bacterium]
MIKAAYFCEPQFGGTFSFFQRMRPRLVEHGIDFRCISPLSGERLAGSRFEGVDGVDDVRFPENDLPAASEILIRHLADNGYQIVVVLPGSDVLAVNLVRYLPRHIRTAARIPMITRGAYAPARAIEPSLDLMFAVSHRVADDLVRRYGIPGDKVRIVYNGVDVRDLPSRRTSGQGGHPFRLLYAGRLSDMDKGVLLLPEILRRVRAGGIDARLAVLGNGPDKERLAAGFRRGGMLDFVDMPGNVALEKVDDFLAETDGFLLPSRFEGCPNALLEAMAAGCACVAARIRGSVDRIVEDGQSGLLAAVADAGDFARRVRELACDPVRCRGIGVAARRRIQEAFMVEHTAAAYAETLKTLVSLPDRRMPARDLANYDMPRALCPTWRTRVPPTLKNFLRKWLERLGISI